MTYEIHGRDKWKSPTAQASLDAYKESPTEDGLTIQSTNKPIHRAQEQTDKLFPRRKENIPQLILWCES